MEWVKYKEGGDPDSHVRLFETTCWANKEHTEEDQLRLFPCTLSGDMFDWYSRYESNFPMNAWEELKVTFKRRYRIVKIDEWVYHKMCAIHMGQEDVEASYKWLTKLNSVLVPPQTQASFLKEMFWSGLWKRLKIFIVSMPRHTLEEAVEFDRQVEDDMMSGWSKTKRKHQNFTPSSSSSTSSSISSSEEEDNKPQKNKKKKKAKDKEQAKIGEEKVMEEEKYYWRRLGLRLQEEQKALVEKIWTTMELFALDTFWNQIFYVYCRWEGHLLVIAKTSSKSNARYPRDLTII